MVLQNAYRGNTDTSDNLGGAPAWMKFHCDKWMDFLRSDMKTWMRGTKIIDRGERSSLQPPPSKKSGFAWFPRASFSGRKSRISGFIWKNRTPVFYMHSASWSSEDQHTGNVREVQDSSYRQSRRLASAARHNAQCCLIASGTNEHLIHSIVHF